MVCIYCDTVRRALVQGDCLQFIACVYDKFFDLVWLDDDTSWYHNTPSNRLPVVSTMLPEINSD